MNKTNKWFNGWLSPNYAKAFVLCLIFINCQQFNALADILSAGTKAPAFKATSGDNLQMSLNLLQGRVVALFYENKDTVEKNRTLKNALNSYQASLPSTQKNLLVGIPIIDCTGAFFPFVNVWKEQLIQANKREGIIIYGDWDGKAKSAYRAADKDSNFYLIDQNGIIRYSLAGKASGSDIKNILKLCTQLLNN